MFCAAGSCGCVLPRSVGPFPQACTAARIRTNRTLQRARTRNARSIYKQARLLASAWGASPAPSSASRRPSPDSGSRFRSSYKTRPPVPQWARRQSLPLLQEALFAVFEVDWSCWSVLQIRTRPYAANVRARDVYREAGQAMVKRAGAVAGGFQQIRREGAPVPWEGRGRTGAEVQASVVSGRRPTRRLTASPPGPGSCRSRFLQPGARPLPGMISLAAHHLTRRMATQGLEIRNGHE